tara:strand:- start:309 stop:449 length:141 start_codon:yes stop_codon:yes gene_type:complete
MTIFYPVFQEYIYKIPGVWGQSPRIKEKKIEMRKWGKLGRKKEINK